MLIYDGGRAVPNSGEAAFKSNRKKRPAESIKAAAIKHSGAKLFSLGALKGRVSFFKARAKAGGKKKPAFALNVKTINLLMVIVVLILSLYLIMELIYSMTNTKEIPTAADLSIKTGNQETFLLPSSPLREQAFYLENVRMRDIFRMGKRMIIEEQEVVVDRGEPESISATKHLRLVGISWSDDPDAMIEDTKALRTFFVKKGDMIGEVSVEAIFKEKVVLKYKGNEVELK